jgi:hypothetical protein
VGIFKKNAFFQNCIFQPCLGIRMPILALAVKKGNPFHGVKNNECERCSQFGPADPTILMAASFEN